MLKKFLDLEFSHQLKPITKPNPSTSQNSNVGGSIVGIITSILTRQRKIISEIEFSDQIHLLKTELERLLTTLGGSPYRNDEVSRICVRVKEVLKRYKKSLRIIVYAR